MIRIGTITGLLFLLLTDYISNAQTNTGRNIKYGVKPLNQTKEIVSATSKATTAISDSIQLNDSQSQTDHNLTGVNFNTGISNGRTWVNATNGNFNFQLKPDSVVANEIKCTFWGGDAGKSSFDVYCENIKLTSQRLTASSPGTFITTIYAIPLALSRHKAKITIKFTSKTDSIAGPLYGCLIQTSVATSYTWPLNIHDPSSIIKCGSNYYIFGTGDGIYSCSSTDLVKWKAEASPFAKYGFPSYITTYAPSFAGTFWAPECFYMNGKYYLYYAASEWGTKNSCIGVATNKTLDSSDPAYNWVDQGLVVSSNGSSSYNAIDPAIMRDPKTGKVWLVYGSFNLYGIQVTELDTISGKVKNIYNQTQICNHYNSGGYIGEASFMIPHNGKYFLFVNYGGCCAGVNSTYYIITGMGSTPTGPFYDKVGANLYKIGSASGGTVVLKHDDTRGYNDRFYGPGCLGYFVENGIEYVTFHYYDPNFPYPGQPAGGPMLAVAQLKWDANDWPVISMDWMDQGRYKVNSISSNYFWEKSSSTVVQNASNSNLSQQWDFYPLGTGEYKIGNASVADNFIEPSGTTHTGNLVINAFGDAIYEKFRILKSPSNQLWFYQSEGLRLFEVPYNSKLTGIQLGVNTFNGKDYQKWNATWVSDIPTKANELNNSKITIGPNPFVNLLEIKNINQRVSIQIYDVTGRCVVSTTRSADCDIDVSGLGRGIYNVRISGNGIKQNLKVVKE